MTDAIATAHVRLRNLSRSYLEGERRHVVLGGVNADFSRGETVALRGRSGSGKSTLLNLVSGIDEPDEGDVIIDGEAISDMSERDRTIYRRKNIGFIYQSFNLVPTLSAADNVRLVLELNGIRGADATERVTALLEAVGLGDRHDAWPDLLSGGEQQRVAIARALAHKPALLLADEPTGNLDDLSAKSVLALLDSMVRAEGGTLIVATHSAAVAAFCDRTLDLREGTLLAGEIR